MMRQNPQKGDEGRWAVPLADVAVDDELAAAVERAVRSGWWSAGPRVEAFEDAFSAFLGSRHALAVANGTAALHLALAAAGIGPGDEVVLPSLNFVAAANAVSHTGARPVFCDIRGDTDLNLDPASLEAAVRPATRALLLLHYGGYPCDVEAAIAIAERHDLVVIEDSAHAPGASVDGRACGTFGRAGCFSFFSNKNLPVGEGGLLCTDDDELHQRARLLRSHGMTTLTWDRHRGHASDYDVAARGYNYRLDEIRAAIGVVQLERLAGENAARGRIVDRYRQELDGAGLTFPFGELRPGAQPSSHLAVAVFESERLRNDARDALAEARIQTSVHYPPIHTFSAYRDSPLRVPLPRTESVARRLLTLPLFGHMRDEQVDAVVETLAGALSTER
jgi:dTDP-4-amino-4,6-dideoxygalactose transaminase